MFSAKIVLTEQQKNFTVFQHEEGLLTLLLLTKTQKEVISVSDLMLNQRRVSS